MTRLIDADAVIFKIWETTIQPEWCKVLTDKVIRDQPTVDAVPVIRCKDCKHWDCDDSESYCDELGIFNTDMNSYCSYAKRKEE